VSNNSIDKLGERITRRIASYSSRRGFLSRVGMALVAAPVLPLLPVSRARAQNAPGGPGSKTDFTLHAQNRDEMNCTYWRYCALDGTLCSCMGGGIHTCPAGASPSPTAWIGTCTNPDDQKSYLVAYHDCCGKNGAPTVKECECDQTDRETPIYRPQSNNDIIWCFGASSFTYHCSVSLLVGLAG
jgi:methylamine dehydrogenase light chain